VGKSAGTIVKTNERLSHALPTIERATRVDADGGQWRTIGFAMSRSIAIAFAHPTALDSKHE
jgi:hypothetical protein